MKTIIREMVETIKQLFAQKQQMQEPIVANCKIPGVVAQKTLKKKEEPEKTGEKTGKSNKWSMCWGVPMRMVWWKDWLATGFL